ncbi:MAG: UDP-N-acetylmuramate dehydrogenase [Chloroflexi bacterium]|nr:UDP-N-acetylmuramate dehydrogenase [Chloroflexota bacterium]
MSVRLELPAGIRHGLSLRTISSLKVGGAAEYLLATADWNAIHAGMAWAARESQQTTFVGGASNLLVSDDGVAGLVVRTLAKKVDWPDDSQSRVVAESGASFPALARALARRGWAGLEWAANVPGTVGGAVVNNAGAFGSSVAEHLLWVEVLGPAGVRRLSATDLDYAYRTSRLKRHELGLVCVVRAAFAVRADAPEATRRRVQAFQELRTTTQPREHSVGSVFANPEGDFAGRLIEACGLKSAVQGGAAVSSQHANFIVNRGNATARDVYVLMRHLQQTVWQETGVWLRPEVELIGRWTAEERAALYYAPNEARR